MDNRAARKHEVLNAKENAFWTLRLAADSGKPSKLWKSLSAIMRKTIDKGDDAPSPHTADSFERFFTDKVAAVPSSTGGAAAQAVLPLATTVHRSQTFVSIRKMKY